VRAAKDLLSERQLSLDEQLNAEFLQHRKIFLWGPVDDEVSEALVKRLFYLDTVAPGKDITLYINSPGGIISSGFAIYDTMQELKSEVATVCLGMAASFGAVLLAAGTKGKRSALAHARIMIHQPLTSGRYIGPASDVKIHADEMLRMRTWLNNLLARHTGQPVETIVSDTDRDYYMSAVAAKKYGLIDTVIGENLDDDSAGKPRE
jgi:ATP-dependent Clp protease protease subunit